MFNTFWRTAVTPEIQNADLQRQQDQCEFQC